jgi:hypothetical protein
VVFILANNHNVDTMVPLRSWFTIQFKENAMAAKITFPNRPCSKCGKPIHIKSKSHEACGWKAEATASPKAAPAKTAPAKTAPANGSISKMEAVRRVLATSGNDTKPIEIQGLLKKNFNIKMDPTVISTYKSSILRQGPAKKKMGRPKGSKNGQTAVAHYTARATGSVNISIEDILAVKELAGRLGAERLRQLAEVLA